MPGDLFGAGHIRARAEELDLRPTKQLGQNFVIDPNTIARIVREAKLTSDDVVLEIGPGLGSLTLGLLRQVQTVIAVEIDPTLARALRTSLVQQSPELAERLVVHEGDALTIDALEPAPTALVANLPYNIAVPVLVHVMSTFPTVDHVLVMVQREVGERIVAGPGSKVYGVPSVKLQWFGTTSLAGLISRKVFWPEPNVDSVLVRIDRTPPPPGNRTAVFALVDAAFGQRRKMLRRALAPIFGTAADIEAALVSIGVPGNARGEELSVRQFAALHAALASTSTLTP